MPDTRKIGVQGMMGGTSSDLDMLKTQIGNLDIYASELQHLEEWDMPPDRRERALKIRKDSVPTFFFLLIGLLRDALIQGLANILDKPFTFGNDNLTLEYIIEHHTNPSIQTECMQQLKRIRDSAVYSDIKRARNKIISHSDYATISNYPRMLKDFPNLTLENLQSVIDDIMGIMSLVTGQPKTTFIVQDWQGVECLFKLLEHKQG
jgi:hypothetical protein